MTKKLSRSSVYVACTLPTGLIISLYSGKDGQTVASDEVELRGAKYDERFDYMYPGIPKHEQTIIFRKGDYGITEVDNNKWYAVLSQYGEGYAPMHNKCVVFASTKKELIAKMKEIKNAKEIVTGFEGKSRDEIFDARGNSLIKAA